MLKGGLDSRFLKGGLNSRMLKGDLKARMLKGGLKARMLKEGLKSRIKTAPVLCYNPLNQNGMKLKTYTLWNEIIIIIVSNSDIIAFYDVHCS